MQLYDTFYYFKSAFTPDECNEIIRLGKEDINNRVAKGGSPYGTVHGGIYKGADKEFKGPKLDVTTEEIKKADKDYKEEKYYVRDSKVGWLSEEWIFRKLKHFLDIANERTTWNWDYDTFEPAQFTVYEKGGFYGWHSDGDSDYYGAYRRYIPGITPKEDYENKKYKFTTNYDLVGKVRKISITVNLSPANSYEGGYLKFDYGPHAPNRFHTCEEIKDQGSLVVFPSFQFHQVTPVTKGTRYSLVLWVNGKPFR